MRAIYESMDCGEIPRRCVALLFILFTLRLRFIQAGTAQSVKRHCLFDAETSTIASRISKKIKIADVKKGRSTESSE